MSCYSISMRFCFQNVFFTINTTPQPNERSGLQAGGFFRLSPPSRVLCRTPHRRGGHVIYVVRRRTTTTTFLNFHFIIRSGRQGNQSASYKLGCARLKNQVSFFSFFLTSFIKVLFEFFFFRGSLPALLFFWFFLFRSRVASLGR